MEIKQKKVEFTPVTITLSSEVELADFVGALTAYGKGVSKAKKSIREAGLEEFYSGNARKTARNIVTALFEGGVIPSLPVFTPPHHSVDADVVASAVNAEEEW